MFGFSSPILKKEPTQFSVTVSNVCKEEPSINFQINQNNENQVLQFTIQKVNKKLSQFCQYKINGLSSNIIEQKLKILEIILFLIRQRNRANQANTRMINYRRKSDQYLLQKQEMLEKISKQQKAIENQKDLLSLKKQNIERVFKQSNEKLILQKDELNKQLKKIQARQKAYQAQFRKKDNQIKFLQDGIRKIQEKNQSKSHFQLTRNMQISSKIKQYPRNGIDQYNNLALYQVQENIKTISKQNITLRQFFFDIQTQLNKVFKAINSQAKSLRQFNNKYNNQTYIQISRPEIFKLNQQNPIQKYEQFLRKIRKLNEFIQDKSHLKQNTQALSANQFREALNTGNHKVKDLLQNYKQIVISQDQILNKVILKSQSFLQNQRTNQQICYKSLEKYEFDEIRILIENQMQYVQKQNKKLIQTKQKLSKDLQRTQKIKTQILSHKKLVSGQND